MRNLPLAQLRYQDKFVQDGFQVESSTGTKFDDVDLSEGEWVEYDEKLGDSVGIYELEHKLEVHH